MSWLRKLFTKVVAKTANTTATVNLANGTKTKIGVRKTNRDELPNVSKKLNGLDGKSLSSHHCAGVVGSAMIK